MAWRGLYDASVYGHVSTRACLICLLKAVLGEVCEAKSIAASICEPLTLEEKEELVRIVRVSVGLYPAQTPEHTELEIYSRSSLVQTVHTYWSGCSLRHGRLTSA